MEIIFGIAALAFIIGMGIGSVFGFYIGESTHKPTARHYTVRETCQDASNRQNSASPD